MPILDSWDIIAIVAERKIQTALDEGVFEGLSAHGRIDCSQQGERFFARWWREKIAREESAHLAEGLDAVA